MKYTTLRVSEELRDKIKNLCNTEFGKVTPDSYLRKILGLK